MTNIILFDDDNWIGLLPLTFTKPICELRVGILTIREKWQKYLDAHASFITQDFLSTKYPLVIEDDNIIINSTILPNKDLVALIQGLKPNQALVDGDELLAARLGRDQFERLTSDQSVDELDGLNITSSDFAKDRIVRPNDIFRLNGQEIRKDFDLITAGRSSKELSETNTVLGSESVFVEEGASVECAIINATQGPVYIGKNAEIMEGSIIRGPLAMCEHSVVKMGAKIYGDTTLGPYVKVGGEVSNTVFIGYSNKGHDGYLGNSVIGEWCNLGADTNSSNLKNNYAEVKIWSYEELRFVPTGTQFCGLIMGDHSKCGINTMFNTGTVVGVSANIFGSGFPRVFIPSFSWGGSGGFSTYRLDKSLEVAEKVMLRRKEQLTDEDIKILDYIYQATRENRPWEK